MILINLSDEFIEKFKDEEEIKTILIIKEIENEIINTFLTPREFKVFTMRFREDLTLEAVAKEFSVLRERIRQIEVEFIKKLRCKESRELIKLRFKEKNIKFGLKELNHWHHNKYPDRCKSTGVLLFQIIFRYVTHGINLNPKYFLKTSNVPLKEIL